MYHKYKKEITDALPKEGLIFYFKNTNSYGNKIQQRASLQN